MRAALLLTALACCSSQHCREADRTPPASGAPIPAYHREDWGNWTDDDRNCRNTRQEVLVMESEIPVTFNDRKCTVTAGRWTDPYSGQTVTSPSQVQIDHVVALEEAHRAGAWRWTDEQKRAYFNDLQNPDHLVAVTVHSNESKGSRPPSEWMPPNVSFRCEYLRRRVGILTKYALSYDRAEYDALMSKHCR